MNLIDETKEYYGEIIKQTSDLKRKHVAKM